MSRFSIESAGVRWGAVCFLAGVATGGAVLSSLSCESPSSSTATETERSVATGTPFLDDTVIAEAGGYQLTAGELHHRIENQFTAFADDFSAAGERSLRNILRNEIDRIVLVAESRAVGHADSSRNFHLTDAAARRKLLAGFFTDEVIHAEAALDEAEIRAFYEQNKSSFSQTRRVAARHILVNTQAEADAAFARLEAGEDFPELARELSLDTTSHDGGGAIGWVSAQSEIPGIGVLPRFNEAVFPMSMDETKIVESSRGWHVVRIIREDEAAPLSFEEVRDQIEETQNRRVKQTALEERVRELRRKHNARLHDEQLTAYLAWRRQAPEAELFARAQETTDPRERIRLYEEYLSQFSHAENACRARFFIAFTYAEELPTERSRARIKLNDFIKECPDSDLADDAKFLLDELTRAKR